MSQVQPPKMSSIIFQVEMLAFDHSDTTPFRQVQIPQDSIEFEGGLPTMKMLSALYMYGQNDMQPRSTHCSVSHGDVIHVNDHKYYVGRGYGFHRLTEEQYQEYRSLPHREDRGEVGEKLDRYDWRRDFDKQVMARK